MKHRAFGKTSLTVSEIGFGGWGIGGSWWTEKPDDRSSLEALRRAVDVGITFYDTALVYGRGRSEQLIGRVLRENPGKTFTVASKIPPKNGRWPPDPGTPVEEAFPTEWIVSNTEKILRNLRFERLDLLQFHVWTDAWLTKGSWREAVERLKKDGKIRLWGVSINDHDPESALELVRSGAADSVQVIFNLFDQSPREKLFPLCRQKGVGVIARVPFDEGSLTGTFTPQTRFEKDDFRREYFSGARLAETLRRVEALKNIAAEQGASMAEAALQFVLSHPDVSTAIPGMRRASHVDQNARVSDGKPFSSEVLERFKAHAWKRNFYS